MATKKKGGKYGPSGPGGIPYKKGGSKKSGAKKSAGKKSSKKR